MFVGKEREKVGKPSLFLNVCNDNYYSIITGSTGNSECPPYENPDELRDVHKKDSRSAEQEISIVDPVLQANPSYEPL